MTRLNKALMAITLSLVASAPVFAGHAKHGDRIAERLERQLNRIDHGIENHQLTRKEAKVLKRQQRRIRHLAYDFRKDGHLSKKERLALRERLDRASDLIRDFKHNDHIRQEKHHRHDRIAWRDADVWKHSRHSHDW